MLSMVSHIYWKQSVNGHCLHLIVAEIVVVEITLPLLLPNLHTLTRILILFDFFPKKCTCLLLEEGEEGGNST